MKQNQTHLQNKNQKISHKNQHFFFPTQTSLPYIIVF